MQVSKLLRDLNKQKWNKKLVKSYENKEIHIFLDLLFQLQDIIEIYMNKRVEKPVFIETYKFHKRNETYIIQNNHLAIVHHIANDWKTLIKYMDDQPDKILDNILVQILIKIKQLFE